MGTENVIFGKVQGADFDIFGGTGLILAVLWEICFQQARRPESREGGGGTPQDLWDELTGTSEGA